MIFKTSQIKAWMQSLWRSLRRQPEGAHGKPIKPIGQRAEALAEQYLRSQGVKILARNVSCRGGEIDLIGVLGNNEHTIIFVEVRLRTNSQYGGAAQSITRAKQRRIALAARHWLHGAGRNYANKTCRFDAILLSELNLESLQWMQNAFTPH